MQGGVQVQSLGGSAIRTAGGQHVLVITPSAGIQYSVAVEDIPLPPGSPPLPPGSPPLPPSGSGDPKREGSAQSRSLSTIATSCSLSQAHGYWNRVR